MAAPFNVESSTDPVTQVREAFEPNGVNWLVELDVYLPMPDRPRQGNDFAGIGLAQVRPSYPITEGKFGWCISLSEPGMQRVPVSRPMLPGYQLEGLCMTDDSAPGSQCPTESLCLSLHREVVLEIRPVCRGAKL